jgi:phosphohistidine swiveling domain-containing protein
MGAIYGISGSEPAEVSKVGGKGQSLMLGSQAGLPVPPGFILSVDFFAPWLLKLKATSEWAVFADAEKDGLAGACASLKKMVPRLRFTKEQARELASAMEGHAAGTLFAVRSSSPEEDLEGASFAGGYETVLGVPAGRLGPAIRRAFSSCLDYRVALYKLRNGYRTGDAKIAVIVQEQIDSEVAGVGFSLNPLTNDYDEALLNANWGLGETVVSGVATPDTYVVDKVARKIKERRLGKKETSFWLGKNGGTREKKDGRSGSFALTGAQVLELAGLIDSVERIYGKPIDIEWAYSRGKLYLLQARPITAFVPLPEEMLTAPGQRRRLYLDISMSLQGIDRPISVAGTDVFRTLVRKAGRIAYLRDITGDMDGAIPWISPGRLYINLSNAFRLMGRDGFADSWGEFDPLAANAIRSVDEGAYRSRTGRLGLLPFGAIAIFPAIASQMLSARLDPARAHMRSRQRLRRFMREARELAGKEPSIARLADRLISALISDVFLNTAPLFVAGDRALAEMKKEAGAGSGSAFRRFDVALPNNMTTEMGLALHLAADCLPKGIGMEDIQRGLAGKTLPGPFMSAWNRFLDEYGFRGPMEIDIAAPRYRDDQRLLIGILLAMRAGSHPEEMFARGRKERREAYERMHGEILRKSRSRAASFQRNFVIFETFAGYRESHKYYAAFVIGLLRERALAAARRLHHDGRLSSEEQVFDLTFGEMDRAGRDPAFDLRGRAKENRKAIDRLARIRRFPSVIDSRGRIIRPPMPPAREGEVAGIPISPGIARGRIKVLHSPDEKPFLQGEVLVARATDPGWTPLFVNASAVILEIGGELQHGALVAREYGLPCVTGVEKATTIWKDGTMVEVDGSRGIIRPVKKR